MADRDGRDPESRDARSRRRAGVVQVVTLVLIGAISAVQLGMTLFGEASVTWRTGVQAVLVVLAPVAALSLWRERRGG